MESVDTFCGHLVNYPAIWYIFPVLDCCASKNLAILVRTKFFIRVKTIIGISSSHIRRIVLLEDCSTTYSQLQSLGRALNFKFCLFPRLHRIKQDGSEFHSV
jgi:hypothetical protein